MASKHFLAPALAGALALLAAGCAASAGASGSGPATPASCAAAARPPDDVSLAAAFDSLHALRLRGRSVNGLVLAPHDRKPRLDNPGEVQQLLGRLYPPALRASGVTGRTEVAALIDTAGIVRRVLLVRGSTYDEFDRAASTAVRAMRFRPARQGSCAVPYFASLPITWTLQRTR